jgi:hypothetical protein
MEKSILAYLRYRAFWNQVSQTLPQDSKAHPPRILTLMDPNVREIDTALNKDFRDKYKVIEALDVN